MTVIDKMVDDLRHLPPDKLAKAVSYVHGLKRMRTTKRGDVLATTASALSAKEVDLMGHAIVKGCERIDRSDW